jgi:hypothetical protein
MIYKTTTPEQANRAFACRNAKKLLDEINERIKEADACFLDIGKKVNGLQRIASLALTPDEEKSALGISQEVKNLWVGPLKNIRLMVDGFESNLQGNWEVRTELILDVESLSPARQALQAQAARKLILSFLKQADAHSGNLEVGFDAICEWIKQIQYIGAILPEKEQVNKLYEICDRGRDAIDPIFGAMRELKRRLA